MPRSRPADCAFCGGRDHPTALCPSTPDGQANRAKLHCSFCDSKLHDLAYCPRTWGGPSARRLTADGLYLD